MSLSNTQQFFDDFCLSNSYGARRLMRNLMRCTDGSDVICIPPLKVDLQRDTIAHIYNETLKTDPVEANAIEISKYKPEPDASAPHVRQFFKDFCLAHPSVAGDLMHCMCANISKIARFKCPYLMDRTRRDEYNQITHALQESYLLMPDKPDGRRSAAKA